MAAIVVVVGAGLVATVVVGDGEGVGYVTRSARWEVRSPIDPGQRVLPITVEVGSSSCSRLEEVVATESVGAVTIDARVRTATGIGCTDDLRFVPAEVSLGGPLGDRQLLGCGPRPGHQGEARNCLDPGEFSQP